MRDGLKARGMRIREGVTPIVPIFTYDAINTLQKATELYEAGVYVNTVLPPAAPADGCMLRCSLMATHTKALLDEAMDIMKSVIGEYNG
jgi:7-keto-8-aminopelargonate synthetase-like enzyme